MRLFFHAAFIFISCLIRHSFGSYDYKTKVDPECYLEVHYQYYNYDYYYENFYDYYVLPYCQYKLDYHYITTPKVVTEWPYDVRVYCWRSRSDCHHPASTPFPGVNFKELKAKYNRKWWEYPCFYYTEDALMSVTDDTFLYSTFKCERNWYYWMNNSWWERGFGFNYTLRQHFYFPVEMSEQPKGLKDFFEQRNFTGWIAGVRHQLRVLYALLTSELKQGLHS